jgi:hypothetical protein
MQEARSSGDLEWRTSGKPGDNVEEKQVEQLAHLGAAIILLRNDPGLLESFQGAFPPSGSSRLLLHDDGPTDFIPEDRRKASAHDGGAVLAQVPPFIMEVDDETISKMRNVLVEVSDIGLSYVAEGVAAEPELESTSFLHNARRLTDAESRNRCAELKVRRYNYMTSPALAGNQRAERLLAPEATPRRSPWPCQRQHVQCYCWRHRKRHGSIGTYAHAG